MSGTTTNLGLRKPTAHVDTFQPQEDIAALADDLDALAPQVGLSGPSVKRRGKSIIATTESRTNVAYGLLTTPDRVQNIVLPTDGLLAVAYQATWQESVNNAARAAMFIGSNQLKLGSPDAGLPVVTPCEAFMGLGTTATDCVLSSVPIGLGSLEGDSNDAASAYSGDVTTGQVLGGGHKASLRFPPSVKDGAGATQTLNVWPFHGGPCYVFAAAGTYDISVQFKASSGSVTVKNRKLWVWALGF